MMPYKFYALLLANFLSLNENGTSEMFNPSRTSLNEYLKSTKAFLLLGNNLYLKQRKIMNG